MTVAFRPHSTQAHLVRMVRDMIGMIWNVESGGEVAVINKM